MRTVLPLTAVISAMLFAAPHPVLAQTGPNAAPAVDVAPPAPAASVTTASSPAAAPAQADPNCDAQACHLKLTAAQILAQAEKYVDAKEFDKARPFVEALGQAPGFELQHHFLTGYIMAQTGDLKGAEKAYRAILKNDPRQTRVRLELGRVLLLQGKQGSADYHFRLAQNDKDLPSDLSKTIRSMRSILRDQRIWHFDFDVGLAPDTNINSATSAETVNINFGPLQLPLTLDPNARAQSGVGVTGGFSGGVRIKASKNLALLIDADGRMVNYAGTVADDIQLQLAAGPELRLNDTSAVSLQALGEQHFYGGSRVTQDYGLRLGYQKVLDAGQRIGAAIDGRHTLSDVSNIYTGWQVGGNITYERVVGHSFIASASLFGRRDSLNSAAYSDVSYGGTIGIGGELPYGINAGVSGSVSRALFDVAQPIYSPDKREDWRMFGRIYAGMRSLEFMGFSPSVEYVYSRVDSNYTLYESNRHRFNFKLSHYF